VRVLLVDDHPGFRSALAAALRLVEGMEVAGEAADGEAGVLAAVALRPDLVVMDLSMPGISGIEATRRIRNRLPGVAVVVLTAHTAPTLEQEALACGASGFVSKGTSFEELIEIMRQATQSEATEASTGA
jgi:DNA-binding NarL/FixJ family response regulator